MKKIEKLKINDQFKEIGSREQLESIEGGEKRETFNAVIEKIINIFANK